MEESQKFSITCTKRFPYKRSDGSANDDKVPDKQTGLTQIPHKVFSFTSWRTQDNRCHWWTDTERIPPTHNTVVTKRPVVTADVSLIHSQRKTEARKWVSIVVTPLSSASEDLLVNNPEQFWTIHGLLFFRFWTHQNTATQNQTTEQGDCRYLKSLISARSLQERQGGAEVLYWKTMTGL